MPTSPPTVIGIAVVEHRGGYLVGTRGSDGPLPGLAEFPGGKCRPGESPVDCAVRECREETGLPVTAVELLLRRPFVYRHDAVDLHFWLCRPKDGQDNRPGGGFRWVSLTELSELSFPEANEPVIEMLLRPEAHG